MKDKIKIALKESDFNKALDLLYKNTLSKIVMMTRQLGGSKEDAMDVFQEALIVLVRQVKYNKFDFEQDVDAYIYIVAKRMMINKRKKDQRIDLIDEVKDYQVDKTVQYHEGLQQQKKPLELIFEQTGEKCLELLRAVFIEELNTDELLERFNIKTKEVLKTTKSRCKKKVTQLFKDQPELKNMLQS